MCDKEIEYIEKYRTYTGFKDCNGYNNTRGGDGKSYLKFDEQEVIEYHIGNGHIAGITAKHYGVDPGTIQKILEKHNIKWLSSFEITESRFLQNYGGLVQMDFDCCHIVDIYKTPNEAIRNNPEYKAGTLSIAYGIGSKTHHAYGYTWYRLYELPEEYKPLLDEYIDSDTIEIDETMLDF